jgi:5-methylcytosine-specific restriction endonuclease McrA
MTPEIRFQIFHRDHYTCQYCGATGADGPLEVDHVLPQSERGDDDLSNLVTACRDCNRRKSGKVLVGVDDVDAFVLRPTVEDFEKSVMDTNPPAYILRSLHLVCGWMGAE